MQWKAIYELADGIAPFALSKEYGTKYGFRDNSGNLLDCGEDVKTVLFALDLSPAAFARAKEIGAGGIVTHHPAIFNPLYSLRQDGAGSVVLECAKNRISVISAHLNLDAAEGGIDDSLMQGLGGKKAEAVMQTLTGGAYGKVYEVKEQSLDEFVANAKKTFSAQRVVVYGNGRVKRVASFCGGGMDEQTVAFAIEHGADTYISSDGKHHLIAEAVDKGLNVVLLTHYASEFYGFTRFYEKIRKLLEGNEVRCELFTDERFL